MQKRAIIRFACSLAVIAAAWLAVDRLGSWGMAWAFRHTHYTKVQKIREIADAVDADVVLLGTSRCEFHYVPSVIADTMGMSVYNAGIDASSNIYSQYMVLSYLLQHYRPKVVCLDTGESEFAESEAGIDFDQIGIFAPLYGHCAAADSMFGVAGTSAFYQLSHLYRYHSNADLVLGGLFAAPDPDEDCGFHPLPAVSTPPAGFIYPPALVTDHRKVDMFHRFIGLCRSKGIQLVLSISPSLAQVDSTYYGVIRDIAAEQGIPLLDYDTSNLFCDHLEYFRDEAHLCGDAARLFSAIFAHDLRETITLR